MSDRTSNFASDLDWVRHVNRRWIVGETLREDAESYLDFLAKTDPERGRASSRRARRLFQQRPPGEDPKPWFYAGLFSLATRAEAQRYLKSHDFTLACIPGFSAYGLGALQSDEVRPDTAAKIRRVRAALQEIAAATA